MLSLLEVKINCNLTRSLKILEEIVILNIIDKCLELKKIVHNSVEILFSGKL